MGLRQHFSKNKNVKGGREDERKGMFQVEGLWRIRMTEWIFVLSLPMCLSVRVRWRLGFGGFLSPGL